MSRHPRADLYRAEHAAGLTYSQIAAKHGVSRQAVAQVCGKMTEARFRPYTKEEVVYPYLRKWLNENKVSRMEFLRRLGLVPSGGRPTAIRSWFTGEHFPHKTTIDKILNITGLTYEELFAEEERKR